MTNFVRVLELEPEALEIVKLYSLRFKIGLGLKFARHVAAGVLCHIGHAVLVEGVL